MTCSDATDLPRVWASRDVPLRLTDDEAAELAGELYAAMQRWVKRVQEAHTPNESDRRTYLALALLFPRTDGS